MNIRRILPFVLPLGATLFMASCRDPARNQEARHAAENRRIIKTRAGYISAILHVSAAQKLDGPQYYFINDTLRNIEIYRNGSIKRFIQLYKSGRFQSILNVTDSLREGNCYGFYDNNRNSLQSYANYSVVNHQEWLNGIMAYAEDGQVSSKTGFATIRSTRVAGRIEVKIRPRFPALAHFKVRLATRGDQGQKGTAVSAYPVEHTPVNGWVTLRLPATSSSYLLQGCIVEYEPTKPTAKGATSAINEAFIYFQWQAPCP